MARPKKRTAEAPAASNTFLDALRFCGMVTKDVGPINETHIHLGTRWATAFNGIIAAGHPINEDIFACPQSKLIIEALSKCNEHISFTQLDNNRLSIKSGKFKAVIPCIDPTSLTVAIPDPPVAVIDDRFKEGLSITGILANENGQQIHLVSILMNGASLYSTNGKVIFEYWHGIDLPYNISLPKALVEPLTKTNKKLARFGFSRTSVTFYFEDESWIKSQLFIEQWPDVKTILDRPSNAWPVSADFWNGLEAVAPFTDNFIYFDAGLMRSHATGDQGASYEVPGLPKGLAFPAKQLALIRPYAQQIDFLAKNCLLFFGHNIRGAVAGVNRT